MSGAVTVGAVLLLLVVIILFKVVRAARDARMERFWWEMMERQLAADLEAERLEMYANGEIVRDDSEKDG